MSFPNLRPHLEKRMLPRSVGIQLNDMKFLQKQLSLIAYCLSLTLKVRPGEKA
jgi:hypothetical protein